MIVIYPVIGQDAPVHPGFSDSVKGLSEKVSHVGESCPELPGHTRLDAWVDAWSSLLDARSCLGGFLAMVG
jgi:hypothetical protein